jgi:ZIP family zinc transporter
MKKIGFIGIIQLVCAALSGAISLSVLLSQKSLTSHAFLRWFIFLYVLLMLLSNVLLSHRFVVSCVIMLVLVATRLVKVDFRNKKWGSAVLLVTFQFAYYLFESATAKATNGAVTSLVSAVSPVLAIVLAAIALGVSVTYILNYLIDRKTNPELAHIDASHPKTADGLDELIHSDHLEHHYANHDNKLALFVAGIVMAGAIALHNVPEGMTIGASYAGNNGVMGKAALALAVLIGLHNIPEGMAVSVPLISGGMGKVKAVLITASSGIPTVVGALLGYVLGEIGPVGLTISLGFASGAMLYVVFGEILPQAILMYHSKLPAFSAITGILAGLVIIFG